MNYLKVILINEPRQKNQKLLYNLITVINYLRHIKI